VTGLELDDDDVELIEVVGDLIRLRERRSATAAHELGVATNMKTSAKSAARSTKRTCEHVI
jgi:hypothetical protein